MNRFFYNDVKSYAKKMFGTLLLGGLFFLSTGVLNMAQAQANDLCSGAITVTCGSTTIGSTVGATSNFVGSCGTSFTAPDVFYKYVGDGSTVTVSTCNAASYDTKISVFSGACGALNCIGGNDDGGGCAGFTSEFTFVTTPGTDYFIVVNGFGGATGMFALSVSCVAPVVNDACAGAIDIGCGDSLMGSTTIASPDGAPFCGTSNTAPGVWYKYAGTGDVVTVSTCSPSTNYDTKISVFSGSCGGLVCVDGGDDDFTCPFSGLQSTVFFASSGVDYYILVHGFGAATGSFELSLDCVPPPANDNACAPTYLGFNVLTPFNNIGAGVQPGEPSPGPGTTGASCNSTDGWCSFETGVQNSVWFRFFSPVPCVNISTDGGVDTQIAIWATNDCSDFSSYTLVGANDDDGPGLNAGLDIEVTPYIQYYVQIDGFAGAAGTGTVLVQPSAEDCQAEPCTAFGYTLTINLDNFPSETTWEVVNDNGQTVQTGGPYFTAGATVVEQICSSGGCFDFTIFDSFGDGICCGFGLGSYTLEDSDGNIIAAGGAFGSSETTSYCGSCESPLPAPWAGTDIGAANGDSYYDNCEDVVVVEASGATNPLSDIQHAVYQTRCGNSSITAKVSDFIGTGGWVGIQMRESLAPGSKKVALKTQLGNFVRREVRSTTNGIAFPQQLPAIGEEMWLRITRTNYGFGASNYFIFEFSNDGVNWSNAGTATVAMSDCIYVGLFSEDTNVNSTTTGIFTDILVTGGLPAPITAPETDLIDQQAQGESFSELTVFPNPASGELNVKLANYQGIDVELRIMNALGQMVINRQIDAVDTNTEEFDISELASGMYYLSVYSENKEVETKKFIVKNNRP